MHADEDINDLGNDAMTERAEEIFCDALELHTEVERKAFLAQACAGDDALAAMVDEMLSLQSDSDRLFDAVNPTSFSVIELAQTVLDASDGSEGTLCALPDDDEVGKQIGLYTLLKKIGEGGGGSVYLAEQKKPVRRQVALKIIKQGMDTKNVIARFEAERQALAMMEHPNIAHVLNAGETEAGRPFFVMELVEGVPITTYCEQNRLGIPHRLELLIQVCHAIQHAHQKGIIHRDIKPSNILITKIDGIATPKVIDFGIAKATGEQLLGDGTLHTSIEHFVGTPAYMSPEQAELAEMDIDIRSDIYSLGVLLYELLTGTPPFNQKELVRSGLDEMRRTIREVEPARPSDRLAGLSGDELRKVSEYRGLHPSRLLALLVGDLDWVVMKALEKERDRRYGSADGLADDIRRYLDHEAVVARPPSRMYRLKKLVRRNKVAFASGIVVVAVLMLSTGVSTWLLVKERVAQQRALRAEQEKGSMQQDSENLAKAMVLFRRGELEQADGLLEGIKSPSASPGNATMYRNIGDWHALNGEWGKAKARFDVLLRINEFEGADSTMDDSRSAALMVDQGYLEEYERLQESLINRYVGTESPSIAQRVLRECLLAPAKEELMGALQQYATVTERSFDNPNVDQSIKGWQAYAMALWTYRSGKYDATLLWCERADPTSRTFPTRALSIRLIQASALWQLGRHDDARRALKEVKSSMGDALSVKAQSHKDVWMGYWFDRSYVRIHLREAESLIESSSGTPD